jgi:predicted methyltransferase
MKLKLALAAVAAAGIAFTSAPSAKADEALKKVIAGDHRTEQDKARDPFRRPHEVLTFFQLKPDMKVAEIWPGGGWFTKVIAPYVAEKGEYTAVLFGTAPDAPPEAKARVEAAKARFMDITKDKTVYGEIKTGAMAKGVYEIAPAGSLDMIVTFRNLHNWMPMGFAEDALKAFHTALKPGGFVGIEDHRADPSKPQDEKAANGRVREDYTIALFEKAGFKFVGSSPVNNNPKDTRDQPWGVWTLPPTLKPLGFDKLPQDQQDAFNRDIEKYRAVGESDRYTLLFQKPSS